MSELIALADGTVRTNDLKKGTRIRLRSGWYATITENAKGDRRMAMVDGFCREEGSVYSHDIVLALVDGLWMRVEHTANQLKLKKLVEEFFGG